MSKLVSIIIPCYNAADYISDTLDSVVNQTYPWIETILVNDGSTDHSASIAEGYSSHLNIQVITTPNGGVSTARNIGFEHSRGEFVLFLDADDLLKPGFIANKVRLLEQSDANGIGSTIEHFRSDQAGRREVTKKLASVVDRFSNHILEFHPEKSTVPSAYLFKRTLFANDSPFHPKLSSTADRYLLLANEKQLKLILDKDPDSGLLYRESATSMSHHFNAKLVRDNEHFYDELKATGRIKRNHLKSGRWMLFKSYLKIHAYKDAFRMLYRYFRHQ